MSGRRSLFLSIVLLGVAWGGAPAQAGDKLVISTSVVAPYTTPERTGFLDRLVAAVFRETGVQAEILVYPTASERSLLNANEGIDDGQALRVAGLETIYPNLIRVPEPVMMNDFVAMSLKPPFATPDWNALRPYTVTYIIGWKIFESNLGPTVRTVPVREAEQMFVLLERGRADVLLHERWQGLTQARKAGLAVNVMEPPLVSVPMHMYLHRKHAALVPKVSQALVHLKQNGSYQRLVAETLKP